MIKSSNFGTIINPEVMELLLACDELNYNGLDFNDLLNDLQNNMIKNGEKWILENLNYSHQILSKYYSLSMFGNHN